MKIITLTAILYLLILITCSIVKQEEYITVLGNNTDLDINLAFFRVSSYTGFIIEALISLIVLLIVGILSFFMLIFLMPDLKITPISKIYSKSFAYILLAISCSEIIKMLFFIDNIDFISFFEQKEIFNAEVLKIYQKYICIDIICISIGIISFILTLFIFLKKKVKYYDLLPSLLIIAFYFIYIMYKNINNQI